MSVVKWPDDLALAEFVECVVCKQKVPINLTTAGHTGLANYAFACSIHMGLGESARFLRAWIDFFIEQRLVCEKKTIL